ncbi:adult-specific cuticular protein ACP-20-like [Toxorhynchites rutilus septentrionalis]|uniref:adult-specific cuticular protein ACP-20-like n=1 Tax=Toxorhynchites rutilus septentrionalis TaxID=329112 RepID=UPI002479F84E|nr:adult-specific cuticular protein ACP-20-like [Toxorhynchites rutilus septentrionalis]
MFKFVLILALAVAVSAQWEGGFGKHDIEDHHHTHPKYKFEYGVKDFKTGDNKDQWEHRDGDVVKGQYTLQEPDGTKRIVEYTSDKHGGFQAHVKRVGHAHHPQIYGHHEGGYGGESSHDKHVHDHASSYANQHLYTDH